jgi:hypothetical protein
MEDLPPQSWLAGQPAYVVHDEVFGTVAFGAKATIGDDGSLNVFPENGVDESVFLDSGLSLSSTAQIKCVSVSRDKLEITIEVVGIRGINEIKVSGLTFHVRSIVSNVDVTLDHRREGQVILNYTDDRSRRDEVVQFRLRGA